jgi:Polyketide cyclase / dehydrase and lipid transport
VTEVTALGGQPGQVGSTYSMHRDLPGGAAENELEVLAREEPTEFAIRTTSGPTPFVYAYRLTRGRESTRVDLHGEVELGGPASLLGPLAARAVKRGVDANLASLKSIVER